MYLLVQRKILDINSARALKHSWDNPSDITIISQQEPSFRVISFNRVFIVRAVRKNNVKHRNFGICDLFVKRSMFKKFLLFKGKWQQNFLSSHLKETPKVCIEVCYSYICFISWHILARNIKLSAILESCKYAWYVTRGITKLYFLTKQWLICAHSRTYGNACCDITKTCILWLKINLRWRTVRWFRWEYLLK